jgi:hypothetical protein
MLPNTTDSYIGDRHRSPFLDWIRAHDSDVSKVVFLARITHIRDPDPVGQHTSKTIYGDSHAEFDVGRRILGLGASAYDPWLVPGRAGIN